MALQSPQSIDVQDIQFKLHDKFTLFNNLNELRSHVNLLSVASNQGLLFAGNPNAAELRVAMLKDVGDSKLTGKKLHVRVVPLHNVPNAIACSADGSMLAVNYFLNGSAFLQIFSVPSFGTPNIKSLHNLRLSADENVFALQLLWNPVLTTIIAVVLNNGALGMYTLQDGGEYEMYSLDKSQQVKCGCWSPKGKQIVLGFPNGKLQQFKPDLTPAKTIPCPGVHPGPFNTIALHWLSTFQFAVVFLQQGEDMAPSLYIVNAPKGGTPSYINYYDICYSATGPRAHQVSFTHIHQWNLLLVTSANGVEVGILGTKETADTPTWVQYTLLDEARIEMPLTDSNDETYPIGFAFDTSSSHQLTIGEQKLSVMPMVHVLSTHGHLVCFNFINLTPGAIDVCSPPPPVTDTSGQFHPLEESVTLQEAATPQSAAASNTSFAYAPTPITSTPAMKDKSTPLFGGLSTTPTAASLPPATGNLFSQVAAPPPTTVGFGLPQNTSQFGSASGFGGFGGLPANSNLPFGGTIGEVKPAETSVAPTAAAPQQQQQIVNTNIQNANKELGKPLYTVPPTFNPGTTVDTANTLHLQQQQQKTMMTSSQRPEMNVNEIDEVVKQMIAIQINSFSQELKQLANRNKGLMGNVKIGNPAEMKSCTRRLNDLQEIIEQANDREFEMDVQNLRHSLNESYAMLTECRTKLQMFNNPDVTRLTSISTFDPINRRQLTKLQSYLATNQAQMQQLQQQIDAQWSCYQDLVRRNTKSQMHVPCLDGIYQRMTKLKDLMARQRTKLNYLKTKLKQKGLIYKIANDMDSPITATINKADNSIDSLTDSILSISLSQTVDANRCKLSDDKLSAIRNFTRQQQKITVIKPQRPNRVGLNSEVILETKLQSERKAREGAAIGLMKMQQEKVQQKPTSSTSSVEASHAQLAKPTATKPMMNASMQPQTSFAPPTQTQIVTPNFNFGGTSPFVKTSSASSVVKPGTEPPSKPFAIASSASGGISFGTPPTFAGFGSSTSATPLTFAQPKATAATSKPESLKEALSTPPLQTPISFSAKIIGGETAKPQPPAGAGTNTITPTTSVFAALSTTNTTTQLLKPSPIIETKKSEDTPKLFHFASASTTLETAPSSIPPFGGFTNTATTKTSLFDGGSKSTTLPTSNFSFGGFGASLGAATTIQPISNASAATTTSSAFNFGSSTGGGTTAVTGSSAVPAPGSGSVSLAKPAPIFAGFNKPVDLTIIPTSNATSIENTGFSFTALNSTASDTTTTTTAITTTASIAPGTSNPTDTLVDSLNICKPTTMEGGGDVGKPMPPAATQNVFAGYGSSVGDGSFSFNSTAGGTKSPFAPPDAGVTTAITTENAIVSDSATTTSGVSLGSSSYAATAEPTPPPTVVSAASATDSVPVTKTSLFSGTTSSLSAPTAIFGVTSVVPCAPATASTTTTSAAVIAPGSATSSIFGGTSTFMTSTGTTSTTDASNSFANAAAATVMPTTTTSPIGAASIFAATAAVTSTTSSIFGAAAPNAAASTVTLPSTNIFGGIPKPDQSVFGSPTAVSAAQPASGAGGGLFAAAAANPSPFSGSPANNISSGGSIFSGAVNTSGSGFGAPAAASGGGSIFGGSATTTSPFAAANSTGSIFGGAKSAETGSIFGSASQPTAAAGVPSGGGSLFGQNVFSQAPQSGGNLFGAAAAAGNQQTSPASGFGSGGSIFGGVSANNASTGGSIFGGAASSAAPVFGSAASGGFGSFSQPSNASAFGSPNAGGGGGAFAQGGASVAHTGFGSPQASAFTKPVFGGTAFGSPPAFGAQPSFGGAATFGSPKPFGSFAPPNVTSPTAGAFTSPTQKNTLFEALGSTDSGISFGNLAQTTNANAPKPTFGGSSFMNYRA